MNKLRRFIKRLKSFLEIYHLGVIAIGLGVAFIIVIRHLPRDTQNNQEYMGGKIGIIYG